jgi:hypothetical protein
MIQVVMVQQHAENLWVESGTNTTEISTEMLNRGDKLEIQTCLIHRKEYDPLNGALSYDEVKVQWNELVNANGLNSCFKLTTCFSFPPIGTAQVVVLSQDNSKVGSGGGGGGGGGANNDDDDVDADDEIFSDVIEAVRITEGVRCVGAEEFDPCIPSVEAELC